MCDYILVSSVTLQFMCLFAKFVDLWVSGENMVDFVGVMLILIQGCASSRWIYEVDDYVWRILCTA